jgi:integrase
VSDVATIDLKYIQRFKDRHGKLRHYARAPGCKRVALPGLPGSREFMEAYAEAIRTPRSFGTAPQRGSFSAVLAALYLSSEWAALNPATQKTYRNLLERVRSQLGDKPAAAFDEARVRAILDRFADRPGAGHNMRKALRKAFAFAVDRKLMRRDPTDSVKSARPKTEGFQAWSDTDIAKFEAHWPSGSRQRLAMALLLYTGQRRSDVVRFGRGMLWNGVLRFQQVKQGVGAPVMSIPLHPALRAELAHWPDGETFLSTEPGHAFTAAGFTNWFRDQVDAAKLPKALSAHGLRKAAARRLAEAGCTAHEIMAITGHSSLKELERYTRTVSQARTAEAAMGKITNGESQTRESNPPQPVAE